MAMENAHEIKQLLRDYFRQAYAIGDESVIDRMMAPDVLNHGLGAEPIVGRERFKQWFRAFRGAFSDIHCSVTHVCVEEDLVAARVLFTGTHTGSTLGMAPSGREVRISALVLARIENGQVVEGFNEFDRLRLLQQVGAAPAGAPS